MLGQILKETREAAGMTQEDLALTAGVDRSYVSQLERDLKSPTVSMLFRLCQAMQASPSAVISRLEAAFSKSKRGR
jgi:transcriptional regulator with XRE-family HTH domain